MDTFEKELKTRSWYNSRLVKAKTSKGGFRIKAFHCLFRRGNTGCRPRDSLERRTLKETKEDPEVESTSSKSAPQ
jgi:hypothetical protein